MFSTTIGYTKIIKKRLPICQWLPNYKLSSLWRDFMAGISVGMTIIPCGLVYATVGGLPPEYGLHSIFDGLVYAIFGTCKDVNISTASILAVFLTPYVNTVGPDGVLLLTFLTGVIILAAGIFNLGFLVDFFSYPVTTGFISAAVLQIAASQLKVMLGIDGDSETFLSSWYVIVGNIRTIKIWDTVLGITCIVVLSILQYVKRYGSLTPKEDLSAFRNGFRQMLVIVSLIRNALVMIAGMTIAFLLRDFSPFKLTGEMEDTAPKFSLPAFSTSYNGTDYNFLQLAQAIGPSIAFIPLIAIVQTSSIARSFSKGKSVDVTQNIIALGFCNLLDSFLRGMPVSGVLGGSSVVHAAGVKTPLNGVFASLFLWASVVFLTPCFYYVPKAALAAIVICALISMFDFKIFVLLWKTKKLDYIPFLLTFICGLFVTLEFGILLGFGVNLCFILYDSARPNFEVNLNGNGIVFAPKLGLHFSSAAYFKDMVLKNCEKHDQVVIDGKNISHLDSTTIKALLFIEKDLQAKNKKLILVNFPENLTEVFTGLNKDFQKCFCTELCTEIENVVTYF